jgi:predicted phosphodiesterase
VESRPAPIRRLGLIGDVHAEEDRLEAALDWMHGQRLDAILCTGDVSDGPGSVDRCCELLEQAGVATVSGNHDRWLLTDKSRHIENAHQLADVGEPAREWLGALPRTLSFDTVLGPLLLCHGMADNDMRKVWPGTRRMPAERSDELDSLLAAAEHRFIVNGHMHFRVLIDFQDLLLVNAGTLTSRHRPGVSVFDFETGYLGAHEFEGARVGPMVAEHPLAPGPDRRVWRDTQEFDGTWTPITLYGLDI